MNKTYHSSKYHNVLTKKFLYKEYIINKKSSTQIAKEVSCCHTTILRRLIKNNISSRTIKESKKNKMIGENNPNYKDGRSSKQYYCKNCGKKISKDTGLYGKSRCQPCYLIFNTGKNHGCYGKLATHGKGSYYKQSFMRSSYELAYAKYCIKNKIKYRYEPKKFKIVYKYLGKKKEGTYTPDFYLPKTKEYIEIKGWWRGDAKNKFNAFKKQHRNIAIKILMEPDLCKLGALKRVLK